jgi:hypothetical protein
MVQFGPCPKPPFDDLIHEFSSVNQVVWSLVGAGGWTDAGIRRELFDLARRHKKITGLILDDFWSNGPENKGRVVLSLNELREIHQESHSINCDIWMVFYFSELFRLDLVTPYLPYIDRFTLWSWDPSDLHKLEYHLNLFRELAPHKPRYLGCYLWDYSRCRPLSLNALRFQCTYGLKLIAKGELEGLIFLGSPVCDVGLKTVEWARWWIAGVRNQEF